MHELSLIAAITKMIAHDAVLRGVARVTQVEIEVGEVSGAFPWALREAFPLATEKTILESASLIIVEVPALAECQDCTGEFSPVVHGWQCPHCGKAKCRLKSGTELGIRSYSGERAEVRPPQATGRCAADVQMKGDSHVETR